MKNEIRTRDIEFNLQQEGHIQGRAICFNEISNVLYDPETGKTFREVIRPEAVTPEVIAKSDIKMLLNHNRDNMLARNNKGRGSLKVELREDGVYFDFSIPNTTLGHDTAEMIRREDLVGCSFAFRDSGATWEFSNNDTPLRIVNNITGLYDFSIVTSPAYDQTSVSARSIEEAEAQAKVEEKDEVVENQEVEKCEEVDPENVDNQSDKSIIDTPEDTTINRSEDTTTNTSYIVDLQHYKEIINSL